MSKKEKSDIIKQAEKLINSNKEVEELKSLGKYISNDDINMLINLIDLTIQYTMTLNNNENSSKIFTRSLAISLILNYEKGYFKTLIEEYKKLNRNINN